MGFKLVKVETSQNLDQFVRLPWKVYKDHPHWVSPLIQERKRFLNPDINPFFRNAEVELYLALDGDQSAVGRIALIDDRSYHDFYPEPAGVFGMYESVDNPEVSRFLLDKAYQWCKKKRYTRLIGPLNMSTNHECGLLIEGFDSPAMVGIPYNPEYYRKHLEAWGLQKTKDLVACKLELTCIPDYLVQAAKKIKRRNHFSIRPLNMKNFDEEILVLWDIYNSAWNLNWGFVPMPQDEFEFAIKEVKPIIEPELCLIAEVKGDPAGFSMTVPDINQVLIGLGGSLFPFGWLQYLWKKNKIDAFRVPILGVKKKYRRLGIDALFYHEIYKILLDKKVKSCEMSWLLEDNKAILEPIFRIGGSIYKRHRIYERIIEP